MNNCVWWLSNNVSSIAAYGATVLASPCREHEELAAIFVIHLLQCLPQPLNDLVVIMVAATVLRVPSQIAPVNVGLGAANQQLQLRLQ